MAEESIPQKICTKCLRSKPLSAFYKSARDGSSSGCKACDRARKHPDYIPVRKPCRSSVCPLIGRNCTSCSRPFPWSEFYRMTQRKDNKDGVCKECRRGWMRRNRFGLNPEQHAAIFQRQAGRCAICKIPETEALIKRKLAVDHNHSNGKIRGLLCVRCNTGLGCFEDSPKMIAKALAYLKLHAEPSPELSTSTTNAPVLPFVPVSVKSLAAGSPQTAH